MTSDLYMHTRMCIHTYTQIHTHSTITVGEIIMCYDYGVKMEVKEAVIRHDLEHGDRCLVVGTGQKKKKIRHKTRVTH